LSIASYVIEKRNKKISRKKTQNTQKFKKYLSIIPKRGIFRSCLKKEQEKRSKNFR